MSKDLVVSLLLKTGTFSKDIKQSKQQIQDFEKGCQTAGRSIDAFSRGLGINITSLTKLGGAIGVATLAGKGFNEMIKNNESLSDKMHSNMNALKTSVDAFFTSISTGNFRGFLVNLDNLITKSKEAYAAMDELGTLDAFFTSSLGKIDYQIASKRNQLSAGGLTPESKKAIEDELEALMKQRDEVVRSKAESLKKAYYSSAIEYLNKSGYQNADENAVDDFFGSYVNFSAKIEELKTRNKQIADQYRQTISNPNGYYGFGGGSGSVNDWKAGVDRTIKDEYNRNNSLIESLSEEKIKEIKAFDDAYWQLLIQGQNTERMINRTIGAGTGNVTIKEIKAEEKQYEEDSIAYLKERLSAEQHILDSMKDGSEEWKVQYDLVSGLNKQLEETQNRIANFNKPGVVTESIDEMISRLKSGLGSSLLSSGDIASGISELEKMRSVVPLISEDYEKLTEVLELYKTKLNEINGITETFTVQTVDKWSEFNTAMSNSSIIASNMFTAFQDGADRSAASILNMISQTLPAIGSLISSISALTSVEAVEAGVAGVGKAVSSSKHWIEAIAAVTAMGAAIASALSSAKSAGNFATGGIVGGSSFTGDRLTANVNSGEMILNRTQQGNLWKQINSGTMSAGQVEFRISGTDLVGVLGNNNKKSNIIR